MGISAQQKNSSFIIALGDNFYYDGVRSDTDPHWQTSYQNIYTSKSLQIPWYTILGNHDYHTNPQAQIDYYEHKRDKRWIMPSHFYSKTFSTPNTNDEILQIIFIDTPILAPELTSQTKNIQNKIKMKLINEGLEEIKMYLKNSKSKWKIIAGHYPSE